MRNKYFLMCVALLFVVSVQAQVQPTDTDGDGYRNVSTLSHLQWLSENSSGWADNYELDNDINASATSTWNSGSGWGPIGNNTTKFSGSFNGNGYKIDGITFDRSTEYTGFFGYVGGNAGVIENLGLTNVDMTGYKYFGALIGSNGTGSEKSQGAKVLNCYATGSMSQSGTTSSCYTGGLIGRHYHTAAKLSDCYSTVDVTATGYYVGGLVGYVYFYNGTATIEKCYTTGDVAAYSYVGGLIGYGSTGTNVRFSYATGNVESTNTSTSSSVYAGGLVGYLSSSTVANSYSKGNVTAKGLKVGGFAGYIASGNITNCYSTGVPKGGGEIGGFVGYSYGTATGCFWDTETSLTTTSAAGTGKTTTEMKTQKTYTDAGWNFDRIWSMDSDYPYIDLDYSGLPTDTDGDGSINISSIDDFVLMVELGFGLDKDWELDNDIDAKSTKNWNAGAGWKPIFYSGNIDGNGFKIDGLYISRSSMNKVGFIGSLTGSVKNLGLTNVNIKGHERVGALVGHNDGNVTNCYSSGTVKSSYEECGGLVGYHNSGTISSCYTSADVEGGDWRTGGFTGFVEKGAVVKDCYATGFVEYHDSYSSAYVGGFVGYNKGVIERCYSTGDVDNDKNYTGGFIGYMNGGSITDCYATGDADGAGTKGGGFAGYIVSGNITNCYSTGSATSSGTPGGFTEEMSTNATVTDCFWDKTTSGLTFSAAGTGKTTAEMKTQSTYTNWDFVNVWGLDASANDGYPFFLMSAPDLVLPTDGATDVGIFPLVEWGAVLGATSYSMQLATDEVFTNVILDINQSLTSKKISTALDYNTKYYWRVNATDGSQTTDWNTGSFTTMSIPAPVLTAPLDMAIDQELALTFTWEAVYGANKYQIQISRDNTFATIDINTEVMTTTYDLTAGLRFKNKYFWRVKSFKDTQESEWSESFSFTTQDIVIPTLNAPMDATINQVVLPKMQWSEILGSASYNVQVATDAAFTNVVIDVNPTTNEFIPTTRLDFNTEYFWRVNVTDGFITSDWSTVYSFTTQELLAPTMVAPVNDATDVLTTPTFDWEAIVGVSGYSLQVANDVTFTDIVFEENDITTDEFTPSTKLLLFGSTYFWRVNASDGVNTSVWSTAWTFTTEDLLPPTMNTPSDMADFVIIRPTLDWSDVTGATGYTVQVATDAAFTNIVLDEELTGSEYTFTAPLDLKTEYFWRINAKDGTASSVWSETRSFTTEPVEVPVLTTPANASTEVTVLPTFDWTDVTTAIEYDLQVSSTETFETLTIETTVSVSEYSPTVALIKNNNYHWRVRASDGTDKSLWSPAFTFKSEPLYPAVLLTPTNTVSTDVALDVLIDWKDVRDAKGYILKIASDADMTNVLYTKDLTVSEYTPVAGELTEANVYYWNIIAYDDNVTSESSETWTFRTEDIVPTDLVAPANNMIDLNLDRANKFPLVTFDWENVNGATSYMIEIATDEVFTDPVIAESVNNSEFSTTIPLLEGTKYFWRVYATNGSYISRWSETWNFTTEPVCPAILTYPTNEMKGIALDGTNKDMNDNFNWEDVTGATSYVIEVATDTEFTHKLVTDEVANSEYDATVAMTEATTYFWRVYAKKGEVMSRPSYVWSFETESIVPAILTAPANNSEWAEYLTTFDWEDVTNAVSYNLEVSTVEDFSNTLKVDENVMASEYTVPLANALEESTKYFWRVQAVKGDGSKSRWSYVWNTTVEPIIPPTLSAPANEAVDVVLRPTFDWDDIEGATSYKIQVSEDMDFATTEVEFFSTISEFTLSADLGLATTYFWRVYATDGINDSRWSKVSKFETKPIVAPVLYAPADMEANVVLTPTFDWGVVSNAISYNLEVSADANFATTVIDVDLIGLSQYTPVAGILNSDMTYYWRVSATDGTNISDWSNVFTMATQTMDAAVLTQPAINSPAVSALPTFKWESVAGATNYKLMVATSTEFTNNIVEVNLTGTEYTLTAELAELTDYYWTVETTDGGGAVVRSAPFNFTSACNSNYPTDTDGDGMINITTICDLVWLSENSTAWDGDYELDNDIDASITEYLNDGAGFMPIGNATTPFTGTLQGYGFDISGLYIDRDSQDNVGLFGLIDGDAEVNNVGLLNVNIEGRIYVGTVVGKNRAHVSHVSATGMVKGSRFVGGIIGDSYRGNLYSSYSRAAVTADDNAGGIVGRAFNAIIEKCYSAAPLTTSTSNNVDALIGSATTSQITNNFFDNELCTVPSVYNTASTSTADMKKAVTFTTVGWDFDEDWAIGSDNDGYPYHNIPNNFDKQVISLTGASYNMISTYIKIDGEEVETMFDDINSTDDQLIVIEKNTGNVYQPSLNLNQINKWDNKLAYDVWLNDDANLTVVGKPVPYNTPIPMTLGWNNVAYLPRAAEKIEDAIDNIAPVLLLMKDPNANWYFPRLGIKQFTEMKPGEGYSIYMLWNDKLVYPLPTGGAIKATATTPNTNTFEGVNPHNSSLLVLETTLADGTEFEAYDTKDNLVGAATVLGGRVVMNVYGDEFDRSSNVYIVKVNGENLALTEMQDVINETAIEVLTYEKNTVLTAKTVNEIATPVNVGETLTLAPNPVNDETQLSMSFTTDDNITVEIYNAAGELIESAYNGAFVNILNINVEHMNSGSYQVVVKANNTVYTTTMVIEK